MKRSPPRSRLRRTTLVLIVAVGSLALASFGIVAARRELKSQDALEQLQTSDPGSNAWIESISRLGDARDPRAIPELLSHFSSLEVTLRLDWGQGWFAEGTHDEATGPSTDERIQRAIDDIVRGRPTESFGVLSDMLGRDIPEVAVLAAAQLRGYPGRLVALVAKLAPYVRADDLELRFYAAVVLWEQDVVTQATIATLEKALLSPDHAFDAALLLAHLQGELRIEGRGAVERVLRASILEDHADPFLMNSLYARVTGARGVRALIADGTLRENQIDSVYIALCLEDPDSLGTDFWHDALTTVDAQVRAEALHGLTMPKFLPVLRDSSVQTGLLRQLGQAAKDDKIAVLKAFEALGRQDVISESAVHAIVEQLESSDSAVRIGCLRILAQLPPTEDVHEALDRSARTATTRSEKAWANVALTCGGGLVDPVEAQKDVDFLVNADKNDAIVLSILLRDQEKLHVPSVGSTLCDMVDEPCDVGSYYFAELRRADLAFIVDQLGRRARPPGSLSPSRIGLEMPSARTDGATPWTSARRALEILGRWARPIVPDLIELLRHESPYTRFVAINSLAEASERLDQRVVDALRSASRDDTDRRIRSEAFRAMKALTCVIPKQQ